MARGTRYVDAFGSRFVILPARLAGPGARPLIAASAARVVRRWAGEATDHDLRALYEELTRMPVSEWHTRGDLAESLVSRELWRIAVVREAVTLVGGPAAETEAAQPEPTPSVPVEKHDLNFTFAYPDGTPAVGYAYRLMDPAGTVSAGKLGADGMIAKKDVRPGTYQVELQEVVSVRWLDTTARAGRPAALLAKVDGFADGARARVRFFREHQELDGDAVKEVDATVESGTVRCTFEYDHAAEDARKAEQGVARFVAEVSLNGGKVWGKTAIPVEHQLKTVSSVRWESARVAPGEEAVVVARVLGYGEGANAKFELWVNDPMNGPTKLAELHVRIEGDSARAAIRFEPSSDPDAPAFAANTIQHPGEYFIVAVIEDDVRREGRSRPVLCDTRPANRAAA